MIDHALASLISQSAGVRVAPATDRTATELPRVLYTQISGLRDYTDDGATGLIPASRWQLDIYAATLAAARTLADTIRIARDGYQGTVEGTRIERIWFADSGFASGAAAAGANQSEVRFTLEMYVAYREPM